MAQRDGMHCVYGAIFGKVFFFFFGTSVRNRPSVRSSARLVHQNMSRRNEHIMRSNSDASSLMIEKLVSATTTLSKSV
jgi:hypothetical protein